ncbi:aspartate/glutamate racemase family protein [Actibacterium ureilyticum]|uniref:aspartate/glutamate racemase family protein n=1 Tax=Actibacterium ureilyticum TaxID=1590614 RepID=UPI000BAAA4F1|nr:aspartate/glutamate racemase family protein [Actibacterium ureilyticum]
MRLLYLNPNSTVAMTDSIVASARRAVPGAAVTGWTNAGGPPAIQGPADGDAAVPGLLAMLPAARDHGADVIVIACFDDTGLEQLRAAAHCPVIGIGQAAYHMAGLRAGGFTVLTTLPVSIPVIEGNVARQGFARQCHGIKASGFPVLTVEEGAPDTLGTLAGQASALYATEAVPVVLGCAGMTAHLEKLAAQTGAPLIDGVRAAAHLGRALALS